MAKGSSRFTNNTNGSSSLTNNLSTRRNTHLSLYIPSPPPIYNPLNDGLVPPPIHYQDTLIHPNIPYNPLGGPTIPLWLPKYYPLQF